MQICHMCKYYISSAGRSAGMCMGMMRTGACQLVQGRISPMGWCDVRWTGSRSNAEQQMMDGGMMWGMV